LFGQKFGKAYTAATATAENPTPAWLKASLEAVDVVGKEVNKFILNQDDKVGYAFINYYDDPSKEYETNSAENGGKLTIKFGN
jgi:hypothetical protein